MNIMGQLHITSNLLERTLERGRLCLSTALVLTLACGALSAQQRRGKSPAGPATQRHKVSSERRAQAITLLLETADKARHLEDLFYRARIQAQVADALWPFEEERARLIFRHAWEAATAFDRAEHEADPGEITSASIEAATAPVMEARRELLSKVAARDSNLAKSFLKELEEESDEAAGATRNQPSQPDPWHEPGTSGARLLALAFDLLRQGDSSRAALMASTLIREGASAGLLTFILDLRERDPHAAETLYNLLLKRTGDDPNADVNSVLLLSAPLISPDLLVVMDGRGSVEYRPVIYSSPRRLDSRPYTAETRAAFYRLAATVLLRPIASREETGTRVSTLALYFATARLLPFFERDAAQYASELRARLTRLGGELEETRRSMLSQQSELRSLSPVRPGDPLGPETEQLARAHDAATRDDVLSKLASAAARHRLWDRARRAAAGIEDADKRRKIQIFIAVSQIADLTRAFTDDHETDLEGFVKFIAGADVPLFAKAWGLAQAAEAAARLKNGPRMIELLEEAEHAAELTDQGRGTQRRIAAYLAVTTAAAHVSTTARAWELLALTVKAVNAMDDYTGDEESLDLMAGEDDAADESAEDRFSIDAGAFRLDGIFATMARLDFDRTLTNARALNGEVPRALASIAVARAELEQRKR